MRTQEAEPVNAWPADRTLVIVYSRKSDYRSIVGVDGQDQVVRPEPRGDRLGHLVGPSPSEGAMHERDHRSGLFRVEADVAIAAGRLRPYGRPGRVERSQVGQQVALDAFGYEAESPREPGKRIPPGAVFQRSAGEKVVPVGTQTNDRGAELVPPPGRLGEQRGSGSPAACDRIDYYPRQVAGGRHGAVRSRAGCALGQRNACQPAGLVPGGHAEARVGIHPQLLEE